MNNAVKWALGALGLLLVAVSPYLWFVNKGLLWITCPLLVAWAAWLMWEYLQWASGLGKK